MKSRAETILRILTEELEETKKSKGKHSGSERISLEARIRIANFILTGDWEGTND